MLRKSHHSHHSPFSPWLAAALLLAIPLTGCLGAAARKLADREIYPIIAAKQNAALGETRDFTLDRTTDSLTSRVIAEAGAASDEFSTEGLRLTLPAVLELAARNSRIYQRERENLYLSAMELTEARREFSPIFTGLVTGELNRTPDAAGGAIREGTIDGSLSMSKRVAATGARITMGYAGALSRFYGGDPLETASGSAAATIVQPLLRGAGMTAASESLTQSEREVIYAVRRFARFEKQFAVDRIAEYYRLLQQLDAVGNEESSYVTLKAGRERTEAMAEAGRIDAFQVDQARQQELSARNRWISAKTDFVQQLDRLKLNLGLSAELRILPDEADLRTLTDAGLTTVPLDSAGAVKLALEDRLDLTTARQRVEDAERALKVMENNLLPDLNARAAIRIPDGGENQPFDLKTRERSVTYGLDAEIPFDRKLERNDYRRALIELDRARRDQEEARDAVIVEVRSAYQNLEEARLSREIQTASLEVANRRVDASSMMLQASRKTVRDVLESETDQRDARNALTRSLIDYEVARLRFLVAIEALEVDDRTGWAKPSPELEVSDAGR